MRIVSLLPSTTEILFALGAGEHVVGVTFECDHPPEARHRRIVSISAMPQGLTPAEIDEWVKVAMRAGRDLYHLDEAKLQSRKIRQLPGSLAEALDELAADEVIRDALGDHVFERFVEAKHEEWDEYRMQVSGWETARYLEAF